MASQFDQKIKVETPSCNVFGLTYESIVTSKMGVGVPVLHKEILPDDSIRLSIDHIMRLAPLQAPVYDDLQLHFRAFFVPNRVLDPRWKEFITGGVGLYGSSENDLQNLSFKVNALVDTNNNTTDSGNNGGVSSLADYLNFHFANYDADGNPTASIGGSGVKLSRSNADSTSIFNLLPFLGYWKVFDDWYRNERIQEEELPKMVAALGASRVWSYNAPAITPESGNPFALWRANYSKDRFTTALPEPVMGGPVSFLPDERLPLKGDSNVLVADMSSSNNVGKIGIGSNGARVQSPDGSVGLFVQLANAATATIQTLKTAFKMYSFFMKDTYNGNRYVEFMQSHYNVRVPDATLDRAIYLGQYKVRVSFGEVFQTSGQTVDDAAGGVLGDYAGRGASYSDQGFLFDEHFLEHGQLYVIATIVPRAKYYQGVDRKFIKSGRFDYFFPEFQNIGDVDIKTKELFYSGAQSNLAEADSTFGFNSRWMEYKESLDEVHGDFLTNMDFWHFGRKFENAPVLSKEFSEITPINDPFTITDAFSDNYLMNLRFNIVARRPIMMYESF